MAARTQHSSWRTKSRPRTPGRGTARRAANSAPVAYLARAGYVARGIMYILIGWIAVEVAFGDTGQQADRTGALHKLSSEPFGSVLLWILVIGFFGMALWRLSEAAFGTATEGKKAGPRLISLFKAVLYAVFGYGTLKYAIGLGAPQGSNQQSVDLTATLLQHTGGQVVVVIAGLIVIGVGLHLIWESWKLKFLKEMNFGQASARTRKVVEWLGRIGGIARGIVFVTAGIFLIVAAVDVRPGQAKGIDSSLRALAGTPAGPWLLAGVAVGLILFGVFSWCQARWRKF